MWSWGAGEMRKFDLSLRCRNVPRPEYCCDNSKYRQFCRGFRQLFQWTRLTTRQSTRTKMCANGPTTNPLGIDRSGCPSLLLFLTRIAALLHHLAVLFIRFPCSDQNFAEIVLNNPRHYKKLPFYSLKWLTARLNFRIRIIVRFEAHCRSVPDHSTGNPHLKPV